MEPRWRLSEQTLESAEFLGGFGRYDLWLLRTHMLRVIWGLASNQWDTYYTDVQDFYHKEDGRPQGEDLENIKQYIRLFAPDAAKALELVED